MARQARGAVRGHTITSPVCGILRALSRGRRPHQHLAEPTNDPRPQDLHAEVGPHAPQAKEPLTHLRLPGRLMERGADRGAGQHEPVPPQRLETFRIAGAAPARGRAAAAQARGAREVPSSLEAPGVPPHVGMEILARGARGADRVVVPDDGPRRAVHVRAPLEGEHALHAVGVQQLSQVAAHWAEAHNDDVCVCTRDGASAQQGRRVGRRARKGEGHKQQDRCCSHG
mmetsp:Transcript_101085/g.286447  ORF Transcript_101085/g.286447 Transcript_101085/m.286447 type:complete len:228 (-) Transcript_101085:72-755(-)